MISDFTPRAVLHFASRAANQWVFPNRSGPQGTELTRGHDRFRWPGGIKCGAETRQPVDAQKGEYDIEVFYVKPRTRCAGRLQLPVRPYAPRLSIGGAKLADDVPGLPHASN
jgi:hypothetical protein